jgi:hypothetical protein
VRRLAPVEKCPSLLHSSNYEKLEPLDASVLYVVAEGSAFAAQFAGRMKAEIWSSPLVQFLLKRDELDLLPWRECMLLRLPNYAQFKIQIQEEWASHSTHNWQLPEVISKTEKRPSKPRKFNFHTWKNHIFHFEPNSWGYVFTVWR